MKKLEDLTPQRYAPVYAAMYPDFAKIARRNGYALAIHGSLQRDFDLIAVPWVENPSKPEVVIDEITSKLNIRAIGEPQTKYHGRVAWTISVGHGECAIDLSFMPIYTAVPDSVIADSEMLQLVVKAI